MVGNLSPLSLPASSPTSSVPELELGESAIGSYFGPPSPTRAATVIDITPPLSSFHYQLKHVRGSPPEMFFSR
jgi:betaine lipid synthase